MAVAARVAAGRVERVTMAPKVAAARVAAVRAVKVGAAALRMAAVQVEAMGMAESRVVIRAARVAVTVETAIEEEVAVVVMVLAVEEPRAEVVEAWAAAARVMAKAAMRVMAVAD